MAKVVTAPKFSEMKWCVVGPLGTGAGSTIFQISDKTAGGKRYALKVVKRDDENENRTSTLSKPEQSTKPPRSSTTQRSPRSTICG